MRAVDLPPNMMTADEFLAWTERDPDVRLSLDDGASRPKSDVRFELHAGTVIAMTPERLIHAEVKAECWLALRNALRSAESMCRAYIDGMGVRIDDATMFQPDLLVRCGDALPPGTREVHYPVIVVEVLSPSTLSKDLGEKLEAYFQLSSVRHYLVIDPDRQRIVHYQRHIDQESLATRIVAAGPITLDPPGIEIRLEDILPSPVDGQED